MADFNQTFAGQVLAPGDLISLSSLVGMISLKLCKIHFQGSFPNVWPDSGSSYRKLLKLYFPSFNYFSKVVEELRPCQLFFVQQKVSSAIISHLLVATLLAVSLSLGRAIISNLCLSSLLSPPSSLRTARPHLDFCIIYPPK